MYAHESIAVHDAARRAVRLGLRRIAGVVLVALLAAAALAAFSASASAVIVKLRSGHHLSYQPLRHASSPAIFDEAFTNLDYSGGPVMPSNTNYTVYWDPSGAPEPYPAGYETGVNRYLEDLAHDSGGHQNVDSVAAQYNDGAGDFANYNSHFGGSFVDKQAYPANGCKWATKCLTDAQLAAELKRFVEEQGLPIDLETEYFLLLPPKVETCFEEAGLSSQCSAGANAKVARFCAYHSNELVGGHQLIYANDPYVGGNGGCDDGNHPNKNMSDSAIEGGLSHEHNESITDPEPNSAWTDLGSPEREGSGENGDKCRVFEFEAEFGEPLGEVGGALFNQEVNGHKYWYQQEWSNQNHTCLQRFTFAGEEPTAAFVASDGAGTKVTLDASGSTAPGGVKHYEWQFNDGPGNTLEWPQETTSPTITHTFPSSGSYTVALTVFSSNGTSVGASHTIAVGVANPTAAFTATPSSITAGESVSFDGSASSAPAGRSITAYSWSFGDGSPAASGASVAHTYTGAGTYEATLTVTDSVGLSSRATHAVSVGGAGGLPAEGGGGGAGPAAPPGSGGEPTTSTTTAAATTTTSGAPTTPTIAAAALTGNVTVPAAVTVKSNGRATAKLSCTGTASSCAGVVVFALRRRETIAGHRHTRVITIGTARFTINSGHSANIGFTLTARGRSLLGSAGGHLQALATLHRTAPAPALVKTTSVRLNLQRRR